MSPSTASEPRATVSNLGIQPFLKEPARPGPSASQLLWKRVKRQSLTAAAKPAGSPRGVIGVREKTPHLYLICRSDHTGSPEPM